MTRRSLAAEIAAFLDAHGPANVPEIAGAVKARHQHVREQLLSGLFQQAPTPEGRDSRARYWITVGNPSHLVPSSVKGQGRAALMLAVLRDGRRHSRAEIFRKTGRYFLTNNAASELRRMGHDVRHAWEGRVVVYWLVSASSKPLSVNTSSISGRVREAA